MSKLITKTFNDMISQVSFILNVLIKTSHGLNNSLTSLVKWHHKHYPNKIWILHHEFHQIIAFGKHYITILDHDITSKSLNILFRESSCWAFNTFCHFMSKDIKCNWHNTLTSWLIIVRLHNSPRKNESHNH